MADDLQKILQANVDLLKELSAKLVDVGEAAGDSANPLKLFEKAQKALAAAMATNSAKISDLTKDYDDAKASAIKYTESLNKLKKQFDSLGGASTSLGKITNQVISFGKGLENVAKGAMGFLGVAVSIDSATDAYSKFSKTATDVTRSQRMLGRDVKNVEKAMNSAWNSARVGKQEFAELYQAYNQSSVGASKTAESFSDMISTMKSRLGTIENVKESLKSITELKSKFPPLGKAIEDIFSNMKGASSGLSEKLEASLQKNVGYAVAMADTLGMSSDQVMSLVVNTGKLSAEEQKLLGYQKSKEERQAAVNDTLLKFGETMAPILEKINQWMSEAIKTSEGITGFIGGWALMIGSAVGALSGFVSEVKSVWTFAKDIYSWFKGSGDEIAKVASKGGGIGASAAGNAAAGGAKAGGLLSKAGGALKTAGKAAKFVARKVAIPLLAYDAATTGWDAFKETNNAANDPNYKAEESKFWTTRMGAKLGLNSEPVGKALFGQSDREKAKLKIKPENQAALEERLKRQKESGMTGSPGSPGDKGPIGAPKELSKEMTVALAYIESQSVKAIVAVESSINQAMKDSAEQMAANAAVTGLNPEEIIGAYKTQAAAIRKNNELLVQQFEADQKVLEKTLGEDIFKNLDISNKDSVDKWSKEKINQIKLMGKDLIDATKDVENKTKALAAMADGKEGSEEQVAKIAAQEELTALQTKETDILGEIKALQDAHNKAIKLGAQMQAAKLQSMKVELSANNAAAAAANEYNTLVEGALTAKKELAETQGLGFGVSLQMQQDIVDSLMAQLKQIDDASAKNLANVKEAANGNEQLVSAVMRGASEEEIKGLAIANNVKETEKLVIAAQEYQKGQTNSLNTQKKIYDITKNVREGYISAIAQMASGAGEFSKIISTQEMGTAGLLKNVNKYSEYGWGSGNSHALGGTQKASNMAGRTVTAEYTTGGFQGAGDYEARMERLNMGFNNSINPRVGAALAGPQNIAAAVATGATGVITPNSYPANNTSTRPVGPPWIDTIPKSIGPTSSPSLPTSTAGSIGSSKTVIQIELSDELSAKVKSAGESKIILERISTAASTK